MPYISEAMREALAAEITPVAETAGELNYLITLTIIRTTSNKTA
jgi:hypothetical protein